MPVTVPLNKTAGKDVAIDYSMSTLLSLLEEGYDTVQWCLDSQEACERCKYIEDRVNRAGGTDLAHFLGYKKQFINNLDGTPVLDENQNPKFDLIKEVEVYRDAPIYNYSHVGCNCYLLVYKAKNPTDTRIVTKEG